MSDYQQSSNNLYSGNSYNSGISNSGNKNSDDEYKKGYKLYNFRRPDKFSKEHLRALQDVHREFSRQLSLVLTAYLRMRI